MDINDLRSIYTLLAFVTFVGIIWWAYSAKRKRSFDEAARSVLDDDAPGAEKK
ncbi:MAG: cbb3-type cytochrome c oxidase subunit 3 [Sulfuritalea sp.]|nr:cbb3-type cytochrome c oxidase subunit 3 [Sulfuritalea sp.]